MSQQILQLILSANPNSKLSQVPVRHITAASQDLA